MSVELVFPKLSDVDEALQTEKDGGVDETVAVQAQTRARLADEHNLNTETLPTADGGIITIITS
jgi:hypothetical protein